MNTINPYAPPITTDSFRPMPQAEIGETELAPLSARFVGAFLDGVLVMAVAFLGGMSATAGAELPTMVFMGVLFILLAVVQCYLISTTGQSLGKRWAGTRIVRDDGRPAGFVHGVLLRSVPVGLLGALPYIGSLLSGIDVLLIFGSERKCLHDHIAGTKVIKA